MKMPLVFYRALLEEAPDHTVGVVFPDFPGCVTAAATLNEAGHRAIEALALHVEGMHADGEALPSPSGLHDPEPDWLGEGIRTPMMVPVDVPGRAVRVNITMDEGLLANVDRAAQTEGSTRSGFLAQAARERLQALRTQAA